MTNPQDNPGTPPPISSNTSSSTPPVESPKPRFRRQKMLARKTVASGPLRKALNEKLKASQRKEASSEESHSSSESEKFISASEGEEPGSSDNDKSQENPREVNTCYVFSDIAEKVDNRFVLVGAVKNVEGAETSRRRKKKKGEVLAICGGGEEGGLKSGGSGSGEAAEGLVKMSEQQEELGSSVEETLADILKKVGASYDPKKRKASSQKTPVADKPSKKSKVTSPKTAATSVPRGRTTRSKVRQSEAELQEALEKSKKKKKEKGKEKVVESSEAAVEEEEEMDLVHQERGTTEEVVPTVKPKRTKTPAKKSSKSVPAEPSLAERTRSAVKGKQVKITEEEDEEWSGEEEKEDSEQEQDRFVIFSRRKILKGRLLKDLEEPGMVRLVDALAAQGWKDMVLQMDGRLARRELIEFMANGSVENGRVTSIVKGVKVEFDAPELGRILDIPSEGYDDYTRQRWPCLDDLPTALQITRNFCDTKDAEEVPEARFVQKSEMKPEHKVLFEFVNKCLLPRQERRHTANYMDLVLMECLVRGKQINWPAFIVKLLDRVINGSKAHATPYGFILTTVLDRMNVPLKKWENASSKEHFGIKTLQACDYLLSVAPVEPGSSVKTPVNSKVRALMQECGTKDAEIARLQARVAELEEERNGLKAELAKEKEKSEGMLQTMLNLLQSQPSSSSKP